MLKGRLQVIDRVGVMDKTNFYAPGEIGKTRRLTPEGFMVCEAVAIARTGEQRYHNSELPLDADGAGEITVMRGEDEVFSEKTMASFEGKPVTVEHPNEFVTPESWKTHAVGTVQNVRRGTGIEDGMLLADLLITDGEAIAYVNRRKPELSCGYDAEYAQVAPGQATQHNIIGNHVALVDRGRAGSRCAIRDSAWDTFMKDAFDPKEKRDVGGKWAKEAKAHANEAAKRSDSASSAETETWTAHNATTQANKTGSRADHDAAAKAHYVAAQAHQDETEGRKHPSHQWHKKAAAAHLNARREHQEMLTKDSSSTTGDTSMKSRFADKFIRVMQAFSAKDAAALDRELSSEDHSTEESSATMDARIEKALDWIDEQRARAEAKDAEEEAAAQEQEDAALKKKAEDNAAEAIKAAAMKKVVGDSAGVFGMADAAQVFKHVLARAEILFPGIAVPTGDSASAKDAIPNFMLAAVKAAYATDAGKAVIDPFLLGQTIEAVTADNVSGVFTGAAELMRQRNNQGAGNTALKVTDFGKAPPTPAKLNEINREFWNKRSSA